MSPVSLDCSFWFPLRCSLTFILPVSCVLFVASFSGLFILISISVLSNVYLSCVLCTICRQFLWIFHFDSPFGVLSRLLVLCLVYYMLPVSLDCTFWFSLRCSLTFICPVSCVLYVASFSGLFILISPSVFSNVYLSCVLCTICRQFLWIVHCWLPLRCSLTFICPVSCVLYVASFSGLFIVDCPFGVL